VIHRSHAPSTRPRGTRPGSAPWPGGRFGGVLALQRLAGNRATRALVARDVVKIGAESVRVKSETERKDAERIISEAKAKFGVTFDSIAAQRTTRKHYGDMGAATEEQLKAVEARPWEYEELQALERAFKHFGPVLGDARKSSSLSGSPQEIGSVGKLTSAPDDDPKHPEDKTLGEYFPEGRSFALFEPAPGGVNDVGTVEQKAVHEIAHGVFAPQLDAFMKMTGYWDKKLVKSRRKDAEGPPDGYADNNASEDLAQSVMYFFTDPERLKQGRGRPQGTWGNPCPKRYEFIRRIVGGWTPKPKRKP
jgi:hypothetical protein